MPKLHTEDVEERREPGQTTLHFIDKRLGERAKKRSGMLEEIGITRPISKSTTLTGAPFELDRSFGPRCDDLARPRLATLSCSADAIERRAPAY